MRKIAENLDFEVTIEGIETDAQAKIIFDLGARFAQGFYFGVPLPAEEALNMASIGARSSRAS